jgi:hypothetical protein
MLLRQLLFIRALSYAYFRMKSFIYSYHSMQELILFVVCLISAEFVTKLCFLNKGQCIEANVEV